MVRYGFMFFFFFSGGGMFQGSGLWVGRTSSGSSVVQPSTDQGLGFRMYRYKLNMAFDARSRSANVRMNV